jgi:hypothetical protein
MFGRQVEFRTIGAHGKFYADLVLMACFVIVLGDSLANFGSSHSNNWVGSSVIFRAASKNLTSQGALFKVETASLNLTFNKRGKQCATALAVLEGSMRENVMQLLQDTVSSDLRLRQPTRCGRGRHKQAKRPPPLFFWPSLTEINTHRLHGQALSGYADLVRENRK